MLFVYKARDAAGKLVKGSMEGAARQEIVDKLDRMGYMATRVEESLTGIKIESLFEGLKAISTESMIMFIVQLSNMINAGISILSSLDTLSRQIENKRLREAVGRIKMGIEAGESFSEALSKYPKIFTKLFVNMIKAGEASGKLDTVLARFAVFFEHEADLKEKVKGALFYPILLFIAGIAVTLFIVTFIIPQFVQIFIKSGITLPIPTQILFVIGVWIKKFWYLLILSLVLLCVCARYYAGTKKGGYRLDAIKLKLPIFGSLHRRVAISRFARTLGTLTASGVPILESLDIVKDVVGNRVLAKALANTRKAVEKGESLAGPLRVSSEFPQDTVQMISVGEESGNLDEMLGKISDFYDMSVGYSIKRLTALIEPVFLALMGIMVGFIMASMLLPIFDMVKILRH